MKTNVVLPTLIVCLVVKCLSNHLRGKEADGGEEIDLMFSGTE